MVTPLSFLFSMLESLFSLSCFVICIITHIYIVVNFFIYYFKIFRLFCWLQETHPRVSQVIAAVAKVSCKHGLWLVACVNWDACLWKIQGHAPFFFLLQYIFRFIARSRLHSFRFDLYLLPVVLLFPVSALSHERSYQSFSIRLPFALILSPPDFWSVHPESQTPHR